MRSTFAPLTLVAFLVAASGSFPSPAAAGDAAGKEAGPAGNAPPLEWLEYGDALDRARKENKHVIVDFYTNWCGWCKVMDRNTYGDSSVAVYLQSHFVLSKVNAESSKRFKVGQGTKSGIELAREFAVNSFPMTWFLKPDGARIDKLPGYVQPDKFQRALEYVHQRNYERKP